MLTIRLFILTRTVTTQISRNKVVKIRKFWYRMWLLRKCFFGFTWKCKNGKVVKQIKLRDAVDELQSLGNAYSYVFPKTIFKNNIASTCTGLHSTGVLLQP